MKNIIILGGARDYHVMDWYRTIRSLVPNRDVKMLTDLIGGEGFDVIANENDKIENLFIIDNFLLSKQSRLGNIWRNIFKLLVLPIQIFYLKKYVSKNPNTIYHAQPMYYMLLCWLSGMKFIGTPQGSEILVRPDNSKLYKFLAIKILQNAKYITVDSLSMQKKIYELSGVEAMIIQYGIDIQGLSKYINKNQKREKITSIRGMTDLYRIDEILRSKNSSQCKIPINFIYPFGEESYKIDVVSNFTEEDNDLGRLNKENMYELLSQTKLVISIPKSDSSPRSVYESIFLGAVVAITYNGYYDVLPKCMKDRIYIVDLENDNWYDEAVKFSDKISSNHYLPSQEALEMFDQNISMQKVIEKLY